MTQNLNEPVSVVFTSDGLTRRLFPQIIVWKQRSYPVQKIGLHHTYKDGLTLFHVFSVATSTLFFRLVLNSDTLFWKLTQISDGLQS